VIGRVLMFLIGCLYLAASVSFLAKKMWPWALLCCCWGIGNLVLAWLAKE
jgi:hypothetical protein